VLSTCVTFLLPVLLCVNVLLCRALTVMTLCGCKCCCITWVTATLIWQNRQLQLCRQSFWITQTIDRWHSRRLPERWGTDSLVDNAAA
jgi:hypothetical protein